MIFNIPHLRFLRCNPWPLFFKSLSISLLWIFLIWECTQSMGYFFWKSYSWRIYVICSQIKLMIVTSLIKVVGASNESEEEQLFSSTNLSMNKSLHDQVKVILLYKQKIYISVVLCWLVNIESKSHSWTFHNFWCRIKFFMHLFICCTILQ